MSTPMILSLGSINSDLEFRGVASLGGGTVRTAGFTERAGGKAANVAVFTHRLGIATRLLGRIGNDYYAKVATDPLRKAGVDLNGVTSTDKAQTGIAIVIVQKNGDKTMLNASNANMEWGSEATALARDMIEAAPENSLLVADFEVPRNVLEIAFSSAERRRLKILVDPTFPEEVELPLLERFHAITPNEQEAEGLLKREIRTEDDAAEAARALNERGVEIACVKLRQGGCAVCCKGQVSMLAAPDVEVVDKTGAGDAFMGAFAAALAEGRPPLEAARWGVAASSFSVGRAGAQASYPTREKFLRFLDSIR
ncbi:PfkB family carbohydrate kinase [Ensifer aridi]|uniref:PfkB family carbohydrate kinase n=1 Tax=Ensifer aridi TaxID=1708715 RepID=UPI000A0F96AC|nr:PfkB family carbohydrate kinase [Ensifer aridi]